MKIKIVHIYFCCLSYCFLFGSLQAQETILDKKVFIDINQEEIADILEEISQHSNIHFSYVKESLPKGSFSVKSEGKKIKAILKELFRHTDMTFFVVEDQVVIKPKSVKNHAGGMKYFTLSGFVRDDFSGEALIGATVSLKNSPRGVATNDYGFYSITLPAGVYELNYSFLGYQKQILKVHLTENKRVNMDLLPASEKIKEVVVNSLNRGDIIRQTQMSEIDVNPGTFEKMPEYFGENDVLKSLQTLPGIDFYGEGSNAFFVRGGSRDQNLILVDEAPIFNPSHFLGFFSSFMPDAINDIKIYKGDIPARYGGRLSSLIDIKTKEGNLNEFHGTAGIGFYLSKIALEGPIEEGKSSFFVSARRSNIEYFFKWNNPELDVYFYDLNGKINFKINDNNRIYLTAYAGQDIFFPEDANTGFKWMNGIATLRWNHIFNDKLFSNTTLYTSKYDYNIVYDRETQQHWKSYIANISFKNDFTWFLNPSNTWRFGFEANQHTFDPGNIYFDDEIAFFDLPVVPTRQAIGGAVYLSNKRNITDRLSVRAGIRAPVWMNMGPATEFEFDQDYKVTDTNFQERGEIYNTFVNLEPRISAKFLIDSLSSFKASYNLIHQPIQLLSNSISPFSNIEVWFPSGPNIPMQRSEQFAAGYFREIPDWDMHVSLESFYKTMEEQIDYRDHAQMLLNAHIEGELRFGKAYSYGLEFMLKKHIGKMEGWLSYTWSRARKQTQGVNNNKPYPALYDKPHDFSLFFAYQLSRSWDISASWTYSTGAAITAPTAFYFVNGYKIPYYSSKNNDRLPDYHRLDLSASLNLNPDGELFEHHLTLSFYNAYNRKNPVYINYNKIQLQDGSLVIPSNLYRSPEYVTTQMVFFGIVPSLTYSIKF